MPLLGLVDTAVIGHLSHAYFLGGSTVGAMIITSITWLCGFLRMSTTGLSAQAFGEQQSIASSNTLEDNFFDRRVTLTTRALNQSSNQTASN